MGDYHGGLTCKKSIPLPRYCPFGGDGLLRRTAFCARRSRFHRWVFFNTAHDKWPIAGSLVKLVVKAGYSQRRLANAFPDRWACRLVS